MKTVNAICRARRIVALVSTLVSATVLLVSCATTESAAQTEIAAVESETASRAEEDAARERLVSGALELLGQKPNAKVTVNGRTFVLDCIGTVSAAYWASGYDIQRDFAKYEGNGVSRLYLSAKSWQALHELKTPKGGDIIFWSNTYDRNENGNLTDDGITHAGLVVEVEEDGTVHYLHESYSRGVVIAYFNLLHPNEPMSPSGKVWNSPMYLGSNYDKTTNPPHWLSGDLWTAFSDAARTMEVTGI